MKTRSVLLLGALCVSTALAQAPAEQPPRELFLAGGSLAICSDLAQRACTEDPGGERVPARFAIDEEGIARASDPALWAASGAPEPAVIASLLHKARIALGARALDPAGLDAGTLQDTFAATCLADNCTDTDARRPWSIMLDAERDALLAALERPTAATGEARARERAHPGRSRVDGGVHVLRAFVAAARARGAERPLIAVVTASAFDPMEPVDFYLSLFEALGASASWWPADAALAAARFEAGECAALPRLRVERLKLTQRERVYPDLAAAQDAYCRSGATMPEVDAVFFAGGDQWRLREAFFDAGGKPNAWLLALREGYGSGRVVVGGTSAGSAVHSGAWMLSNGSVEAAVRGAIRAVRPPEPGCARGRRCGAAGEDDLTLWPAGGLGLAAGAIVDTHFSERARELRLLLAMQAAGAHWGYGADETSALHMRESGTRREISALGEHGGWVFERAPGQGSLSARAWYLAPGATLVIDGAGTQLRVEEPARRAARRPAPAGSAALNPGSAFESGALRTLAQRLALRCGAPRVITAGAARAQLACAEGHVDWRGPKALDGVGPMELRILPRPPLDPMPAPKRTGG